MCRSKVGEGKRRKICWKEGIMKGRDNEVREEGGKGEGCARIRYREVRCVRRCVGGGKEDKRDGLRGRETEEGSTGRGMCTEKVMEGNV